MEPHLLHDLVAHNTNRSMAELAYAERSTPDRPVGRHRMFAWLRLGRGYDGRA